MLCHSNKLRNNALQDLKKKKKKQPWSLRNRKEMLKKFMNEKILKIQFFFVCWKTPFKCICFFYAKTKHFSTGKYSNAL